MPYRFTTHNKEYEGPSDLIIGSTLEPIDIFTDQLPSGVDINPWSTRPIPRQNRGNNTFTREKYGIRCSLTIGDRRLVVQTPKNAEMSSNFEIGGFPDHLEVIFYQNSKPVYGHIVFIDDRK